MNDDQTLPEQEDEIEDQLLEETAKGEGMVITPDDLPHARLVLIRDNQDSDETFEIRGKATIGRFDEAVGPVDIDLNPLPEGIYVSRKHAEISHDGNGWVLKDLGSSNGTFVKGDADFERIDEGREIGDGENIAFGNVRFRFEVIQPEAPIAAPTDEVIEPQPTE